MKPKVEAKPAAQKAVQEVAAHPEDEDARAALRLPLRKLLAEDEALARAGGPGRPAGYCQRCPARDNHSA